MAQYRYDKKQRELQRQTKTALFHIGYDDGKVGFDMDGPISPYYLKKLNALILQLRNRKKGTF